MLRPGRVTAGHGRSRDRPTIGTNHPTRRCPVSDRTESDLLAAINRYEGATRVPPIVRNRFLGRLLVVVADVADATAGVAGRFRRR